MKQFTIAAADADRRLDKWLMKQMPAVPASLIQKYIRLKRVKLNGRGAQRDTRLQPGDVLCLYVPDECFERPRREDPFLRDFPVRLDVVYEDEHLLLIDKRPGVLVHPDEHEKVQTLLTHVRAYLYQKGEYDSKNPEAFTPAPCNRIDRFTGGIVIFAKTAEALHVADRKIRDREIDKRYLCVALGEMRRGTGLLDGYILKSPEQKRVQVLHRPAPGAQHAQTKIEVLDSANGLSLVHCQLLTGRTHQIRAQMAEIGHPLLGDGQYGDRRRNQRYGREFQALYAYQLTFEFRSDAGVLNPLNGRTFQVRQVPFLRDYFPDYAPARP